MIIVGLLPRDAEGLMMLKSSLSAWVGKMELHCSGRIRQANLTLLVNYCSMLLNTMLSC